MTDINIRLKILNDYKEKFASYRMDVGWVSYYVKEYSIDPCDSQTHSDAIKKLKENGAGENKELTASMSLPE